MVTLPSAPSLLKFLEHQEIDVGLYIVSTPIGNASDISMRALSILNSVDYICCEDTRVTAKLLSLYGIRTPLSLYHEYNARRVRPKILQDLTLGKKIALVSDAGTPLISDPGYKLAQDCLKAGIRVIPIPGASSILAALVSSGQPCHEFMFVGFLPPKSPARLKKLEKLKRYGTTILLFEASQRLLATLHDIRTAWPNSYLTMAREITKKHEEFYRGPIDDVLDYCTSHTHLKGEIVLILAPGEETPEEAFDLASFLQENLMKMSVKDAVREARKFTSQSNKDIYKLALELKDKKDAILSKK